MNCKIQTATDQVVGDELEREGCNVHGVCDKVDHVPHVGHIGLASLLPQLPDVSPHVRCKRKQLSIKLLRPVPFLLNLPCNQQ